MAVACPNMKPQTPVSQKRTLLTQVHDLIVREREERLNKLSGPTPPDGDAQAPEPPTKHG